MMGCSSARKSLPVVQISLDGQSRQAKPPIPLAVAKQKTADKKRQRIDFHCSECGVSRTAYPNFKHKCEPGLVSYQYTRQAICSRCEHNDEGVCRALVAIEPSKPGQITVGLGMPDVRCPDGRWPRVRWNCQRCGSSCFDERGLTACPVCHPAREKGPKVFPVPRFHDTPRIASRPLAVVSVAVGQKAIDLAKITWPRMQRYADFVGADFVTILDDQFPDYRLGNKFRIGKVVENYDRALYLDADLWLMPDVGDLFTRFPGGSVWMHPDSARMADGHIGWVREESARMAEDQGIEPAQSWCYNSGVVLFDGREAGIWNPPPKAIGNRHVAEQFWIEHQALTTSSVDALPSEFNCQWYWPEFRKLEPSAKIIHLANCPHGERISRLSRYERRHNADFV